MFNKVLLYKEEKQVIKKIAKIQIKNLQAILDEDCEVDLTMYEIENGLTMEEIKKQVLTDLNLYKAIYEKPDKLFLLTGDDMAIAKHVMFNFITFAKYDEGKRKVWRKLLYMEILPICLQ